MLLTRPKAPNQPRRGGGGPLSTRGGTVLVAMLLSLVAGAALLVFLRQYREDVTSSDRTRVLVAASLVPEGTPGNVVLEKKMYRIAHVRTDDVRDGALTDPSDLDGKAIKADVFPGHQIALDDLTDASGKVGTHLSDFQRAMTVPVDASHGMLKKIEPGDRVDVITTSDSNTGGVTVATVAARDVLVLDMPETDSSSAGRQEPVTIRVPDQASQTIAAAADGGKVWLVLRPAVGARSHGTDATVNTGSFKAHVDINAKVEGN